MSHEENDGLPSVGGERMERTIQAFVRSCRVLLADEQRKVSPDNALIATLCDSVRLTREMERMVRSFVSPAATGFGDMAPIDFRTFQRLNAERVPHFKHTLDEWSEMEWGCAAAGEVGELCNMLKKRHRQGDPDRPGYDLRGKKTPTAEQAGEEIADSIIYLAACASRLRVDLNNAIRAKWNKVSEEVGFAGRL